MPKGNPVLDILSKPAVSDPTSSSAFPPQWGATDPGTSLSSNPNNNFILQAIGAGAPSYNPNYDTQVGVPVSNTPGTNSQTTPGFMGNMPRTSKGLPTSNLAPGATNG